MRRGTWHQFGHQSQRMVIEQLDHGNGVGVIISPRDLAQNSAITYSQQYRDRGAHVLVDPQFYVPNYTNKNLSSYGIDAYRQSVSQLHQLGNHQFAGLAQQLESINRACAVSGVISPAIPYEAGRPDIARINEELFNIAKQVGDTIGVPTYATVVLGDSTTASQSTMSYALSQATALQCNGWYFSFEFEPVRIPNQLEAVYRCGVACLTLACTGKPVMHAFAGPMALLSFGFGATGAAIGHYQNLWHFNRGRWVSSDDQGGGGGNAPSRLFSKVLWGTVVYPDETVRFSPALRQRIFTPSPYAPSLTTPAPWPRHTSNKHLIYVIGTTATEIAAIGNPRSSITTAQSILRDAVDLHSQIASPSQPLRDGTNSYQTNWLAAITRLVTDNSSDYDYLDLL